MGRPKAWLPFGGETMLQRIVRVVGGAVDPVVVVAASGQDLPSLPAGVEIAYDEHEGRGPLQGLAAGLTALAERVDAVFASSCDVPFLKPELVRRVIESLDASSRIAVPRVGGYDHPLAAVYRVDALAEVEQLLAANRLRPPFLFDIVPTRFLGPDDFTDVDPALDSFRNINTPAEYEAALAMLDGSSD